MTPPTLADTPLAVSRSLPAPPAAHPPPTPPPPPLPPGSPPPPHLPLSETPSMRGLRLLLAAVVTLTTFLAAVAWQVKQDKEKVEPTTILPALDGPSPRWLKGNLHTHSFWSDGDDFPEM